jgi:hypothetical protein
MRWPWQRREVVTSAPSLTVRIRNEIAQLESIRDDAQRVHPGSPLHQWINGAIFALAWAADHNTAALPSATAALRRSGIEP